MKVLNFGSLNIDYVYKVDHIIIKGETQQTKSRQIFSGGKGLNQSIAMAKAGLTVYHAGNIGRGGEFLLDVLRDGGVHTDYVRTLEDVPTGHTIIQNDKDGDNCILLFGGANQKITEEQVDETIGHFESGDYLVIQNEINMTGKIMEAAHNKGMRIVLNPSPYNEKIEKLPLEYTDTFFLNEIEASQMTGGSADDSDELLTRLEKKFPDAHIILTLGSAGSVYDYRGERVHQNSFHVKAVDTTAAGDTFTGFFLSGISRGMSPAESLKLASKASAIAVTRPGAAPSIPTLEEVNNTQL
ncbi:MAG: ribokinase [Eubacteriales bacterium]|jgi:ribokinase